MRRRNSADDDLREAERALQADPKNRQLLRRVNQLRKRLGIRAIPSRMMRSARAARRVGRRRSCGSPWCVGHLGLDGEVCDEPNIYIGDFVQSYLECALWSSHEYDENGEDLGNLDEEHTVDDFAPEAAASAGADCGAFIQDNWQDLLASGLSAERAGHDFWLSRNGHGAGFFDEGLGALGDRLQRAARVYGEVNYYVGEDGLIYE